jgi:hypothetical protein
MPVSELRLSASVGPRSERVQAHDGRATLSPAAVGFMLVHCSTAQPGWNRNCAIPVETAQLCKYASRDGGVFAGQGRDVCTLRTDEEVVMRRFIIVAAILLSCGPSFAQMAAPSTGTPMGSSGLSAMGNTAAPPPPGASAAAAALDGAGIPLGTTDLFVGGLSPSPTDLGGGCAGGSGIVTLGTGAIFSGDGTLSSSSSDLGGTTTSSTDCSIAPTAGDGPLGLSSTTGAAATFGGGNIPLAATALPTTGLGGTIGAPGSSCSSTGASVSAASPLRSPFQNPLIGLAPGAPTGQVC